MKISTSGLVGLVRTDISASSVSSAVVILSSIISGLMPVLRTLATALFIDTALAFIAGNGEINSLYAPILAVAGVVALEWAAGRLDYIGVQRLRLDIRAALRPMLTDKCARLEYAHIENPASWDVITKVTRDPDGEFSGGLQVLGQAINLTISVTGIIVMMAAKVWWAAAVTLAFSVPMMYLAVKAGRENYQAQRDTEREERLQNYLFDTLTSRECAEERAMFGYTDFMTDKYRAAFTRGFKMRFKTEMKWFFRMKLSGAIFSLISVGIALTLLFPAARGDMSIGLFTSLVGAAFSLVQSMSWEFTYIVDELTKKREYMKDVKTLMELSETQGATDAPSYPPIEFASLEICNLAFAYPGSDRRVLDGLNLSLRVGEHVALVGVNGAGKTTLIKLLCGLYTDYEGEILINGRELRTYSQADIKSLYAAVFQDFARYEVSLGDNVTAGLPGRDAASYKKLGIDLEPDTLMGKLDKDGRELSGGQWQRVAIARALANPAPVRILDEPTSALDPVAESEVYENFRAESHGVATLFISHRLGSTKLADRICVLSEGRLIEEGSHEELMAAGGEYAAMFEAQREWYK